VLRQQRNAQRRGIGHHVTGVGEQGQRAGEPAAARLDQRETDRQYDGQPQCAAFARRARCGVSARPSVRMVVGRHVLLARSLSAKARSPATLGRR
jgi:hypothetical protein